MKLELPKEIMEKYNPSKNKKRIQIKPTQENIKYKTIGVNLTNIIKLNKLRENPKQSYNDIISNLIFNKKTQNKIFINKFDENLNINTKSDKTIKTLYIKIDVIEDLIRQKKDLLDSWNKVIGELLDKYKEN